MPANITTAVEAFRAGDDSLAMSILMPVVEASARRLFGSGRCAVDIDELVQQSVIGIWEKVLRKVKDGGGCESAYVRKCTYFALLQAYRRERLVRSRERDLDNALGIPIPVTPSRVVGSWVLEAVPPWYQGFLEMLIDYIDEHGDIRGFVKWAAAVLNVSPQRVSQKMAVLKSCLRKAATRRGRAVGAS